MHNVVIIGSTPAVYTAALYAATANLSPLLVITANEEDDIDYSRIIGLPNMTRDKFRNLMIQQLKKFNVTIINSNVDNGTTNCLNNAYNTDSSADYVNKTMPTDNGTDQWCIDAKMDRISICYTKKDSKDGNCDVYTTVITKDSNEIMNMDANSTINKVVMVNGQCVLSLIVDEQYSIRGSNVFVCKRSQEAIISIGEGCKAAMDCGRYLSSDCN